MGMTWKPSYAYILAAIILAPIGFWSRAHPDQWPLGLLIVGGLTTAALVTARLITGRWPN